jgi:hypothetical protein
MNLLGCQLIQEPSPDENTGMLVMLLVDRLSDTNLANDMEGISRLCQAPAQPLVPDVLSNMSFLLPKS